MAIDVPSGGSVHMCCLLFKTGPCECMYSLSVKSGTRGVIVGQVTACL